MFKSLMAGVDKTLVRNLVISAHTGYCCVKLSSHNQI